MNLLVGWLLVKSCSDLNLLSLCHSNYSLCGCRRELSCSLGLPAILAVIPWLTLAWIKCCYTWNFERGLKLHGVLNALHQMRTVNLLLAGLSDHFLRICVCTFVRSHRLINWSANLFFCECACFLCDSNTQEDFLWKWSRSWGLWGGKSGIVTTF